MPHLKPSEQDAQKPTINHGALSSEEAAMTEADQTGNALLSLSNSNEGQRSQRRLAESHSQKVSLSQVTPSPYLTGGNYGYDQYACFGHEQNPTMWTRGTPGYERGKPFCVYGTGARRLFPSPIRYSRSKSDDEDIDESSSSTSGVDKHPTQNNGYTARGPPPHARIPFYGPPGAYPYPAYPPPVYGFTPLSHQQSEVNLQRSPLKKRLMPDHPSSAHSHKRWKSDVQETAKEKIEKDSNAPDHGQKKQCPPSASGLENASKQRVISPSSSIEGGLNGKSTDDEGACGSNHKSEKAAHSLSDEPIQRVADRLPLSAPPDYRYEVPNGGIFPPSYPLPAAGMHGYPPQAHYGSGSPHRGPWRTHLSASYPPLPPYFAHSSYHAPYSTPYGAASIPPHYARYPMPEIHGSIDSSKQSRNHDDTKLSVDQVAKANPVVSDVVAPKIKSVAEWQKAALANGKAPSANRCVPLKAPIPSKYWGEEEKCKDFPIPDFHQLVNFPDYLTKMRPPGIESTNAATANNGKRFCVMCGKQRICSASTVSSGGNAFRRNKKQGEEEELDDDDSNHIIPRQNKGLCTACDISVWVFLENGLEIKWCKGCKNFRPWAAFGDKGMATKCVRCRDRQREKYAIQKDELRQRRLRINRRDHNESVEYNGKDVSECQEIVAAKGLRDLMSASACDQQSYDWSL